VTTVTVVLIYTVALFVSRTESGSMASDPKIVTIRAIKWRRTSEPGKKAL